VWTYLILSEKEKSKTKAGPTPNKRSRKELKEGEFDINSIMPWKLDFTTNEKEATFWLWEQKWRTFYNFIGTAILWLTRISLRFRCFHLPNKIIITTFWLKETDTISKLSTLRFRCFHLPYKIIITTFRLKKTDTISKLSRHEYRIRLHIFFMSLNWLN